MPDWLAQVFQWFRQLYSTEGLKSLVASGGLVMLTGIIFAETGLLAGFFLPGDSLLVTAGVFCSSDPVTGAGPPLTYWKVLVILSAAAILGDWVNFWMGAKTGDRIWDRPDGRFFKRRYLLEAQEFYARHGGLAVAACRFVPIARTFVPFAAGLARMRFHYFLVWNAIGGIGWVCSLVSLGFWFGRIEFLVKNLELLILVVVAISLVPLAVGVVKRKLRRTGIENQASSVSDEKNR